MKLDWRNSLLQFFFNELNFLSAPHKDLRCLWNMQILSLRVVSKTKHSKMKTEAPKSRKRSTYRKRSTQISKTKHPKTRKRRPLNLKPVCPLQTRDSLFLIQKESSTITNRIQPKSTQVELWGVVNAFPPLRGRLCFGSDQKTENAQTISRMVLHGQEKPTRRQSPTHSRALSSPLSSVE